VLAAAFDMRVASMRSFSRQPLYGCGSKRKNADKKQLFIGHVSAGSKVVTGRAWREAGGGRKPAPPLEDALSTFANHFNAIAGRILGDDDSRVG
jgi:hypothetical protein